MCPTLWNILYDGLLKMQLPRDLWMTFPLLCPHRESKILWVYQRQWYGKNGWKPEDYNWPQDTMYHHVRVQNCLSIR